MEPSCEDQDAKATLEGAVHELPEDAEALCGRAVGTGVLNENYKNQSLFCGGLSHFIGWGSCWYLYSCRAWLLLEGSLLSCSRSVAGPHSMFLTDVFCAPDVAEAAEHMRTAERLKRAAPLPSAAGQDAQSEQA